MQHTQTSWATAAASQPPTGHRHFCPPLHIEGGMEGRPRNRPTCPGLAGRGGSSLWRNGEGTRGPARTGTFSLPCPSLPPSGSPPSIMSHCGGAVPPRTSPPPRRVFETRDFIRPPFAFLNLDKPPIRAVGRVVVELGHRRDGSGRGNFLSQGTDLWPL